LIRQALGVAMNIPLRRGIADDSDHSAAKIFERLGRQPLE